jgi:hypothetical protein
LATWAEPAVPYNRWHANSDTSWFVTTTIGHAAELSVSAARTRFQKFVPFSPLYGRPHPLQTYTYTRSGYMAFNRNALRGANITKSKIILDDLTDDEA